MTRTLAVVISLERETERRRFVTEQMEDRDLEWRFFNAIDARKFAAPPPEYDASRRRRLFIDDLRPGELGCFLSHREVWRACVEMQRPVLVLEDDFKWAIDRAEFCGLIDRLEASGYSLVRLSGVFGGKRFRAVESWGRRSMGWLVDDPAGTAAYWVTPEAAKRLLAASSRIWLAVDDFMHNDFLYGVDYYAVQPYPIVTEDLGSTIPGGNPRRLGLSAKLLRELNRIPFGFRRRMHRLRKALALRRIGNA